MKTKIISAIFLFVCGVLSILYGFLGKGASADYFYSEEGLVAFGFAIIVGFVMILTSSILFTFAFLAKNKQ